MEIMKWLVQLQLTALLPLLPHRQIWITIPPIRPGSQRGARAANYAGTTLNNDYTWSFTTTEDADPPTVRSTSPVSGNAGVAINSSIIATFTPSSNLSSYTTYTATITTGVMDLAGNAMASDYTWSFTTVETTPPTVISTIPVNGAAGVAINSAITATFNEAMQSSTIDTDTFTVSDGS